MPIERLERSPNAHRRLTKAEKMLVTQAVAANPAMTPKESNALAKAMNRSPRAIRQAIEEARGAFMGSAKEFVDLHKQGVRKAIEAGPDTRGFSEALRSLQWAIERMADGSTRIVEKDDVGHGSGQKIMIGVKVGGQVAE